ncbi:MAG: Ig-like domain repeat protein [Candidatus Poribacteria bacterium]|nr:Ig-like domain repeat protein [Candidatus Poribacteria bacterium]
MPKIKNICGVACKPKLAIISQVFVVCLAVLLVPADVWAGLTSLSLDAKGDSIFRGEKEHLNIVFSVDNETAVDGDSYTVRANQHLIRRGTIFRNLSVRISWNGRVNDVQLADGTYTISVVLDKEAAPGEVLERTAEAILDTRPPRISSIFANDDPNLLLTNGILINVPLRNITVIPDVDEGSAIDFAARRTNVVLRNARGVVRPGSLNYTTQLSFSLGNPLDVRAENGSYTLTITLVDKAGNLVQETTEFTFDNVPPNLVSVAGNTGAIAPGSGVSRQLDFVEATLADNFENGVNLSGSTIRLTGPEGEILGRQTFPGKNKIRWVFLSPLLPKDGLRDGEYTVEVVGTDNAGNQSGAIRVPFVYDNLAPQLVSLSPTQDGGAFNQIGDTIYQNQPLTQIVAVFNDGDAGVGVDFEQGTRIQFSAIGAGNTAELLTGRTFVDRTNSQITYVLDEPLVSQDGSYRLDIQFADTLGSRDSETFLFLYDTQLPTLVSTFPAPNETVDNLSQIRIVLNETASGIDFIQSSFRLTREVGGAQIDIPVNIANNGRDTATLTVLEPIALDGSDDGTYVIEVTPTDRAGNLGAPARREFYLVSQTRAEVRLTMPEETIVTDLETVVAALTNYIGTGINFNESTLTVTNPQGVVVPERRIETDTTNNLLTWSTDAVIPRDGTADGEYTITATFVDFSGKRFTQEFPVFLDTQFPAIESVRVETRTQPLLSVNRTTDLTAGFSQIVVNFGERSGSAARNLQIPDNDVDFVNTGVTLVGPTGENIPVNRFDNGRTTLTLNFQALTQSGNYTLSITPQDTIGNRSTAAFVYRFQIDVSPPVVSSVLIDGEIGGIVYVNGAATAIEVTFTDPSGVGVDLGDGGSTITVTGPTGIPAPGITTRSGTNQLRWVPVVLPTDGTADGSYTVAVTPVDRTGRQGQVVYRQLIYDTQEPRITASTPVALLQPVTYIGGTLTQLQFTIEDVGPAGLDLEEQTVSILDARSTPIAAARIADEINGNLYLTLDAPFARDGSMDGEYRVRISLVDRAGNRFNAERRLIYDSQVPRVSAVTINTASPMELLPQRLNEIVEPISHITVQFEEATRVDFDNTVITLVAPNNVSIPLTLRDDGKSRLTASFLDLHQVGVYTLSVTSRDIAGNVAPGSIDYRIALGLTLPSVSSVVIGEQVGDVAYLNSDNVVIDATFLDPTDIGLALDSEGSSIVVRNASGMVVPGQTEINGVDQLVWRPISLPADGSVDGRYTVEVTPVDKLGRRGDIVSRQFIYDTEMPRITSGSPLILSEPVSYIPGDFRQFVFTIEDVGPAGLFFGDQEITLMDAAGNVVPTTMTFDELTNQLYLTPAASFPRDGSADGQYTVQVSLVDKAQNRLDSAYVFVYDSKAPRLTSVLVNTDPPVALVPDRTTEFLASISSITLAFEELTEVDFSNTVIELVGPDEAAILLTLEDDGISKVVVDFLELTQIGSYTLSVTPQDIAGNAASGAASYEFVLDIPPPSVDRVVIAEQEDGIAYVNAGKAVISVRFLDPTETGLVLGSEGSNILVTSASGAVVPGRMSSNGVDQLTWQPLSLPTDGSADGQYTVEITSVDKAGRRGDVVYRQFIYDTEKPRITAASPLILSDPVSYIPGDFRQFVFTIEDVGPAGLFFGDQEITLMDAAGNVVPTTMTFDELTNQLYLTPAASFPRDGSADGQYTVQVSLVDKAQNRLDSAYVFVYDSKAPRLTSVLVNTDPPVALVPDRTTEFLASISSITLAFEELTEVDFSNTVIELVGPDEAAILLTLEDDGVSEVVANFLGLTEIGSYTLSVTPQDIAGNAASGAASYEFILDIPLPSVDRVIIGEQEEGVAYVNAGNMVIIAALLDPTETGLAFGTQGSIIQVQTPDGIVVPGITGSNGVDLIGWEPAAFTSDGSTDGRYSVYVVPIDKAGRQGNTVYREFVYDTQKPQITFADPVDLSQPVSYISDNLTQFHFSVEDVGPADLELSAQKVSLLDVSGNPVPVQLTNDTSSEIFLTLDEPLSRDGSMDGNYTVRIELADKSGNAFGVEHRIVYDTQAPTLVSTVPADGALVTEDRTQVLVTLNDDGGSGMDWEATTLTLIDPNGTQISGELVSDAATQLTLNTNQLIEDGRYIIRVRAIDRAGNGRATVFERGFQISRRLPILVSTLPTTMPVDEAFSNEEIDQIEVTIENDDENHLSTLRLLNASNQVVAGQQLRETDRLIYNLARPLAVDGSDDGIYTIEFTPISGSGRIGDIQFLTFTHDTEVPEVEPEAISLIVTSPDVNNSLTEIHVNPTDEQSGIDWENVDEEWLVLERVSPNPTKIDGRVEDDNQTTLRFVLAVPLADNGSADGEYRVTVTPKDQAGNGDVSYEKVFTYDTSPPMIDAGALLLNDAPLLVDINAIDYPTAVSTTGGVVIQANMFDTGLGVNLAQSRIVVRGPDGAELSGNTQQNGIDTLLFKSDGLTAQGLYQITVISVGNDSELLGFAPTDSITTEFLYETTVPTGAVTSDGGETELTDAALPLEGTASDPTGTQRVGEGEISVPASGVWLVEIVGIGPDNQPIDPVPAVDDSNAEQEPWSIWSIDFLPTRSGEYDLDVRVTDNAGNYAVYDIGEYTMSVSLTFREPTFGWPNPLRISRGDVAFFSFDVNVPLGETVELTLSIYDWSGDMILSQTYPDVVSGQRNDQLVKWNLENQAGNQVARGLYIFRLEAINAAGNSANAVGKVLVVE